MSYFIIIRGPLGCGKSTIAQKLSEALTAEYVSIDKILEEYGLDKADPEAECIPAEKFIKANEIILPGVKEKLKNGKRVVFDACFYHKEPIEHLIKNLPYPNYIFTLKTPVEVCIARDSKRSKTHGEDAARAVHKLVSRFDYGTVIDANKPLDETLKEILSHLPKP
jgi:thymidylate kinase